MNGLVVIPKMAGIESNAKMRSVMAIVMNTMSIGVHMRLPL